MRLLSAEVRLIDSAGCATVDSCSSGTVALAVSGERLSAVCEAGAAALSQTWTSAPVLAFVACTSSSLTVTFDAREDPIPFFWRASNLTLRAPLPGPAGAVFETNAVVVSLPPGSPPLLTRLGPDGDRLRPVAGGSAISPLAWGDLILLRGGLLGRATAAGGGSVTALARSETWARGAAASQASLDMLLLPASLPATFPAQLLNDSLAFVLRFIASAPCAPGSNRSCAAPLQLALRFTLASSASRHDSGGSATVALAEAVPVDPVIPVTVSLPALIPRAGVTLSAGAVQLPQPPWTAAELAMVGASNACRVLVGPFSAAMPCPSGSTSLGPPLPPGVGIFLPVTLVLGGGLLNVSLGNASYAPAGITAVSPAFVFVPPAASSRDLVFNISVAAADDAQFYKNVCLSAVSVPGSSSGGGKACCQAVTVVSASGSSGAGSYLACRLSARTLRAALPSTDDVASFRINFAWSGLSLAAPDDITAVVVAAPVLQAVAPPTLSPGSTVIIIGSLFCRGTPSGTCPPSAATAGGGAELISFTIGGFPCADLAVLTDGLATCIAPPIASTEPGYPNFAAVLVNGVGVPARTSLNVSYPSSGYVQALAPLPRSYLPSDSSAARPVPRIVVGVSLPNGARLIEPIECGVAPRTAGTLLVPLAGQEDLSAVAGANGTVDFGSLAVQVPFTTAAVTLAVTCAAKDPASAVSSAGGGILALLWRMEAEPLAQVLCTQPPTSSASLQPLPTLRVALLPVYARALTSVAPYGYVAATAGAASGAVAVAGASGNASNVVAADIVRACSKGRLWQDAPLPPIACSVSAAAATDSESAVAPVVQNGVAQASATSATAELAGVSLGGQTGVSYSLSVRCSIGSIAILPAITWQMRLTGCARGTEPQGSLCAPCAADSYSDGGSATCRRCPVVGTSCSTGILRALPGYYRPPRHAALPLDSSSELHECPLPSRCLVFDSFADGQAAQLGNSSETGDAQLGNGSAVFANVRLRRALRENNGTGFNTTADGGNTTAATWSNSSSRTWSCLEGTTGPLCGRCDEANNYASIGISCVPCAPQPVNKAIVGIVVLAYVAVVAFVALRKRNASGRTEDAIALRILLSHIQAAGSIRSFKISGTALFKQVMAFTDILSPSVVSQGPTQCALRPSFEAVFFATLLAPVITSALALMFLLLATLANVGPAAAKGSSVRQRLRTALEMRAHTSLLLFVLQLAYMPLVSACIGVFDCTPPIDSVRYLNADLRVECQGPSYVLMSSAAAIGLVAIGIGFPALVVLRLRRVTASKLADPHFAATWSFMTSGYRAPSASAEAIGGTNVIAAGAGSSSDLLVAPTMNPLADIQSGAQQPRMAGQAAGKSDGSSPEAADSRGSSRGKATCRDPSCVQRWCSCCSFLRRKPENMAWYEATVLLRKGAIVMLARLVSNALMQVSLFQVLIIVCLVIHISMRPYVKWRFQFAEGASLLCIALTAALAGLVQPGARLSAAAVDGVTVLMLGLNFAVVLALAGLYVKLLRSTHEANVAVIVSAVNRRLSRKSWTARPKTPVAALVAGYRTPGRNAGPPSAGSSGAPAAKRSAASDGRGAGSRAAGLVTDNGDGSDVGDEGGEIEAGVAGSDSDAGSSAGTSGIAGTLRSVRRIRLSAVGDTLSGVTAAALPLATACVPVRMPASDPDAAAFLTATATESCETQAEADAAPPSDLPVIITATGRLKKDAAPRGLRASFSAARVLGLLQSGSVGSASGQVANGDSRGAGCSSDDAAPMHVRAGDGSVEGGSESDRTAEAQPIATGGSSSGTRDAVSFGTMTRRPSFAVRGLGMRPPSATEKLA